MIKGSQHILLAFLVLLVWTPNATWAQTVSTPESVAQATDTGGEPISEEIVRPILTLRDVRQVLHERNYDLEIIRRAIEQAQLLHDTAVGTLLPRVDIQGTYTLRDEEILFEMPNTYAPLLPYLESVYNSDTDLQDYFTDHPEEDARALAQMEFEPSVIMRQHSFAGALVVTQSLFNYRSFALLDLAEITNLQAQNGLEQAEFQLNGAVNQMYFGAVGLQRFIEVSERNVELAELTHKRASIAFEEQVGNQFEVTRAQVALSRARRDLESAGLAYQLAISALSVLLDIEADFDVEPPPELTPPEDVQSLTDYALLYRPEMESYDLAVEFGHRYIDENRAQWWPTLMAQGIVNLQQASTFGGDELSWMVIVTASWNVYDGGLRSTETDNRELSLAQSELRREQGRARIEGEIQQAWLSMESQTRQVASARAEAELAQENLELTQTAWELGAATELEVEYAREALFLSELATAASEVQLQGLIYELYRLAGELRD